MSKIRFGVNDQTRVLLSDMLPYETPLIFSNHGFFRMINSYENNAFPEIVRTFIEDYLIGHAGSGFIPFSYSSNKPDGGKLTLSVLHPGAQYRFIQFYANYDSLIVSLCAKSNFSIRYPRSPHGKFVFEGTADTDPPRRGDPVDIEGDEVKIEKMYPNSYFIYGGYTFLYKFFESPEFVTLEKRYRVFHSFDISKCFYNIYTHSLSWMVKDKDFAKINRNSFTFENEFDQLMQMANYKETNGIPVGPEVSRIFAEVIFQEVDRRVEQVLFDKDIRFGEHYSVRRYVDDHFVFAVNEDIAKRVGLCFEEELEKVKLYVHGQKTEWASLPFMSGRSFAKREAGEILKDFWNSVFTSEERGRHLVYTAVDLKSPRRMAKNIIQSLKKSCFEGEIRFNEVCSRVIFDLFTRVRRRFHSQYIDRSSGKYGDEIGKIFEVVLEIASYMLIVGPRVQTIIGYANLVLEIRRETERCPIHVKEYIDNRILEELSQCLLVMEDWDDFCVEKLNVVLLAREVNVRALSENRRIRRVFDTILDNESGVWSAAFREGGVNYFGVVVLLYCIERNPEFSKHREALVGWMVQVLDEIDFPSSSAQETMALLDLLACPYLDREEKKHIFDAATDYSFKDHKARQIIKNVDGCDWFTAWRQRELASLLEKRVLRPAYEA